MSHSFESRLAAAWPADRWRDVTALVAVSGGPDSTALVRALGAIRPRGAGRLIVAHYNHALRGAESDEDERFVAELARSLEFECCIGRAKTSASFTCEAGTTPASEEHSRAARYDFLIATAKEAGARYVVTAHTADDQAETVLHRIVRGTGLSGLAGIPRARELAPGIALIRPLLGVRRREILAYLDAIGQPVREDSTNLAQDFTRNRLRHDLLPKLASDYNPRIVDALLRLSELAGDAQQIINVEAAALAARCVVVANTDRIVLATAPCAQATTYLVREMLIGVWQTQNWPLQAMGYEEWESLAAQATAATASKRMLPGGILAERTADQLTLTRPG